MLKELHAIWTRFYLRFIKPEKQFFRMEIRFHTEEDTKLFFKHLKEIWHISILEMKSAEAIQQNIEISGMRRKDTDFIVITGLAYFTSYEKTLSFLDDISYSLYQHSDKPLRMLESSQIASAYMKYIDTQYEVEWITNSMHVETGVNYRTPFYMRDEP